MQIRCTTCTKTIAIAPTGALPPACPHCAGAPVPRQLGPFVLSRLVATGGMGEVYFAQHAELGTEVALKLLPAMPLAAASSVRERFAREARLTARIQHPGVVRVLDADVAGDRPYLVLEFVDGETLRHRLANGPLPVVDAARIAACTADVVAAAHREGVLHRDIKPDNVMLARDGAVRVLDFGIARALGDETPLTRTGEILGTPEYMAPEQLLDGPEATDERTDVHALGVLLYELLTQRSPFHGANLFQALKLVESLVPPKPSSLRAGAAVLDDVVLRALQKRREDRFATAAQFGSAVRAAVPEAVPAVTAGPSRMVWYVWLPLAAVLVLGIGGIAWLSHVLRSGVAEAGEALGTVLKASANGLAAQLEARVRVALHVAEGQWCSALDAGERILGNGDPEVRPNVQDAFLFAHLAWPLAANLPPWLGCCDERQRERLFGSALETPADEPVAQARALLAHGEPRQALALLQGLPARAASDSLDVRRLVLLAAHAWGADAGSLRTLCTHLSLDADALARLVSIRFLTGEPKAQAFAEYGARLPIDAPEHWLAQRCAEACRRTSAAAAQAAEMAWLHGAGELAVLLDAGLQVLRAGGVAPQPLPPEHTNRLLRRVAGADPADTPASIALRALLQLAAGDDAGAEPTLAGLSPGAPASLRPFQDWLAAMRSKVPAELATCAGLAQARLGNLEAARSCLAAAKTPTADFCTWLLSTGTPNGNAPRDLSAPVIAAAAELVRGDASKIERLLSACADASGEVGRQLLLLRLAVLAGAEPDFTTDPWRVFAMGPLRTRFDEEANGGLHR